MKTRKWAGFVVALAVMSLISTGCVREGLATSRWGGEENSYHLIGERVAVDVKVKTPQEVAGIGEIVGAGIDFVEEQLRKEAARYSQDYMAGAYISGDILNKATPDYPVEITVTRYVKKPENWEQLSPQPDLTNDKKEAIASKWVLHMTPTNDNARLFAVTLESYEAKLAKAKIAKGKDPKMNVGIAVSFDGLWTDSLLHYHQQNLTIGGGGKVSGYKLGADDDLKKTKTLGYVYAPATTGPAEITSTVDKKVKDLQNGSAITSNTSTETTIKRSETSSLFVHFTGVVNEKDDSKASQLFISGADLLKENKEKIVGAVAN